MNFWTAPIFTFFSRPFYATIAGDRSKKGVLYLLYLSAMMAVVMLIVTRTVIVPSVKTFMDWTAKEMPILTISPAGEVSMDRPSPYTMVHPELGPIVLFKTDSDELNAQELSAVQIAVTRSQIHVNESGEAKAFNIRDILDRNSELKNRKEPLVISADTLERFSAQTRPLIFVMMGFGTLVGFFVWKILVALIYSWVAVGFNRMRAEPLSYGKVFDLTIYALTPAIGFQTLRLVVPFLGAIPFLFVLDMSISLAFLYFAVKMSELPGGRSMEIK